MDLRKREMEWTIQELERQLSEAKSEYRNCFQSPDYPNTTDETKNKLSLSKRQIGYGCYQTFSCTIYDKGRGE